MKLTTGKLEQLCIKYLNRKEPEVNCCGCCIGAGEVLYMCNKKKFREQLTLFINKLVSKKMITVNKHATNVNDRYRFVINDDSLELFKYVD